MPGSNSPYTKLSAEQVLQQIFDEVNDRIRVDASVSASISSIDIDADDSDIAIKDRVTGNLLAIEADGSINSNIVISHTSDSIKVGDGTDFLAINSDGSINVSFAAGTEIKITDGTDDLAINADGSINVAFAAGAEIKITDGTDDLAVNADGSINVGAAQSGTWNITDISGTISLPTGAATAAKQDTGNTSLSSIDGKIPSNLTVSSTRLLVDGSGVTQPVSGTFWQATQPVSGTVAATQSGTWTVQPGNTPNTTAWLTRTRDGSDQTVTKAVTAAGDELVLNTNGASQLSFHAVGAFSGLIAVYASNNDGTTWLNIPLFSWTDFSKQTFSGDANIYSANIGGFKQVKIRQVTLVSGTPTIYAWLNHGAGPQIVTSPLAASFLATASQGGTWTVQPGNTVNTTPWRTSDTVNGAGVQGALNVTNASATEVKVGGSQHTNRKLVTLYNNSSVVFYWGWTNAVTSSSGTPIQPQQFASWNAQASTIYVIAASGTTNDSRVTEVAF